MANIHSLRALLWVCMPWYISIVYMLFPDVSEYEDVPSVCGAGSTCTNTDGSYTCTCVTGFEMVSGSCIGEYNKQNLTAKVAPGFKRFKFIWNADRKIFSRYLFSDTNECDQNNGGCTENANCVNTLGSSECQCQRGYTKINGDCTGRLRLCANSKTRVACPCKEMLAMKRDFS